MNLLQLIGNAKVVDTIHCVIVKTDKGYMVKSEKGKNLGGPYTSRGQAEKRLAQVEYFKHSKGKND